MPHEGVFTSAKMKAYANKSVQGYEQDRDETVCWIFLRGWRVRPPQLAKSESSGSLAVIARNAAQVDKWWRTTTGMCRGLPHWPRRCAQRRWRRIAPKKRLKRWALCTPACGAHGRRGAETTGTEEFGQAKGSNGARAFYAQNNATSKALAAASICSSGLLRRSASPLRRHNV